MLESLTAARAAANGKPRWAEKTPRHLLSLPAIRAAWPDAQIVRVVRDPRDVALSASRVPFADHSVVVEPLPLRATGPDLARILCRGRQSYVLRFEDLLADPQAVLERLCAFLGESFDPLMVARPDAATVLPRTMSGGSSKAAEPLDPSRAGAWRADMSVAQQRVASLVCREQLEIFGYEGARQPSRFVALVPLGDTIASKLEGLVTGLAEHDAVIAEPPPLSVGELGALPRPGVLGAARSARAVAGEIGVPAERQPRAPGLPAVDPARDPPSDVVGGAPHAEAAAPRSRRPRGEPPGPGAQPSRGARGPPLALGAAPSPAVDVR